MVTAKGHPSDLETARSLGALYYINKPWAHGEVELRVQWAITSVQRKREQDAQLQLDRLASWLDRYLKSVSKRTPYSLQQIPTTLSPFESTVVFI
ncbi:MAG: hypothetical protein O2921_04855 [Chloroflexi bacterium]|jgi:DNA-binding response OmpR family regulator|nr:hypothetical protein [Chloroflexota bacterium]MDA1281940.1 hypothetical protein [Chloroflexota bacterium]